MFYLGIKCPICHMLSGEIVYTYILPKYADELDQLVWYGHCTECGAYTDLTLTPEEASERFKHGQGAYRDWETDRKSTRLNSSHLKLSRMPSSA